jgi:hypothetical protein
MSCVKTLCSNLQSCSYYAKGVAGVPIYGFIRCILATVCLDVSIMADTKVSKPL